MVPGLRNFANETEEKQPEHVCRSSFHVGWAASGDPFCLKSLIQKGCCPWPWPWPCRGDGQRHDHCPCRSSHDCHTFASRPPHDCHTIATGNLYMKLHFHTPGGRCVVSEPKPGSWACHFMCELPVAIVWRSCGNRVAIARQTCGTRVALGCHT